MKFVIFGATIRSSSGNGAFWRSLCRALTARGHVIVFFERSALFDSLRGRIEDHAEDAVSELTLFEEFDKIRFLVRRQLADADVAIVAWDCPDVGLASELVLGSAVPLKVFQAFDAALALGRLSAQPGGYPGAGGLAGFDLVLSSIGGRALDDLLTRFSARRVAALYPAAEGDATRPSLMNDRFRSDLSFVCDYDPTLQPALDELLVKPARHLTRRRFLVGGANYPYGFAWTSNMAYFRDLRACELLAVYGNSRLTLNVAAPERHAVGFCPSAALFEAASLGTAVLAAPWEGMELFFEPGAEILHASTAEQVGGALELSDEQLRRIGERARERVRDEHMMSHRAQHLEVVLENTLSAPEEERLSAARNEDDVTEGERWRRLRPGARTPSPLTSIQPPSVSS